MLSSMVYPAYKKMIFDKLDMIGMHLNDELKDKIENCYNGTVLEKINDLIFSNTLNQVDILQTKCEIESILNHK